VDLLQARQLGRIRPELRAANTSVFMLARGPVVTGADAESDLAELKMPEELLPFLGAEIPVFFAGSQ
jgi:hypothetical protein